MRGYIAQKFITCLCLLALGKSVIVLSPSYGHDFVNTDILRQKGDGKRVEEKNAEMLKQFAKFLRENETKNTETEEVMPRIMDKNFRIIDGARDELEKIFDHYSEILILCPEEDKSTIECISSSIFERKIVFQDVMAQSPDVVERAIIALIEILKGYEETIPHIQDVVVLLRCLDIITGGNSAIMETLKNRNNIIPLMYNDAEEIYDKIEPMLRYSDEITKVMVKSAFIDATKTRFEDKPNIPSYYVFHLMQNILEKLEKTAKDMNQSTFNRRFENAVYSMQKLLDDLDNSMKSDQVAKNIVPLLNGAKKTLLFQRDFIQKKAKEWKEYLATLETVTKQVKDVLKKAIEVEKDQSIFDNMPEE